MFTDDNSWYERLYITEVEKQSIENKLKQSEDSNIPLNVQEYHSIIYDLLSRVTVFGYAPYDPKYGDDRICQCGHPYYRHFDSYENMSPVGCKYCSECERFIEET